MAKNRKGASSSFYGSGLTTTASVTLVLLLLGLTILVGFMGRRITSFIKENMTITVEISDKMKDAEIVKLQDKLTKAPFVKEITYISKEDIKNQLILDLGRDPEEILGYNPASSCFEVNLHAVYVNPDSIKSVEKYLRGYSLLQNVLYNQDDINTVNSNLSRMAVALIAFAFILTFISFTLIRNTIRLNIYSKRFTINTMRLVGATNAFIRRPFAQQMVLCGIISAVLANVLITATLFTFTQEYPEVLSIIKLQDLISVYIIVFVLGILLTYFAARLAVNKYLKMETNNLYHI